MSYLSAAHNVYRKLEETDFKKILGGYLKDYDKVFASLEKKFGFDELRKSYAEDIQLTTNNYLPFFKEELKKFFQIKEVTYYQNNLPLRTLSLLMWVWEKKLDLSENHFKNL